MGWRIEDPYVTSLATDGSVVVLAGHFAHGQDVTFCVVDPPTHVDSLAAGGWRVSPR